MQGFILLASRALFAALLITLIDTKSQQNADACNLDITDFSGIGLRMGKKRLENIENFFRKLMKHLPYAASHLVCCQFYVFWLMTSKPVKNLKYC